MNKPLVLLAGKKAATWHINTLGNLGKRHSYLGYNPVALQDEISNQTFGTLFYPKSIQWFK